MRSDSEPEGHSSLGTASKTQVTTGGTGKLQQETQLLVCVLSFFSKSTYFLLFGSVILPKTQIPLSQVGAEELVQSLSTVQPAIKSRIKIDKLVVD